MTGLNINPALIREEVLEGNIGLRLGTQAQTDLQAATDAQIDEALDRVFDQQDHPIHEAVDAVVVSVTENLAEESTDITALQQLETQIRAALPAGTAVEMTDEAILIGGLRADELTPLTIFDHVGDGFVAIAPDPHSHQRNTTDIVRTIRDEREVPAVAAALWDEINAAYNH